VPSGIEAEQGDADAQFIMAAKMTPAQIAEAQRM